MTTNPNTFTGTDSERIQAAVNAAAAHDGHVTIPARVPDAASPRDYWLLDRAILLPGNTTLVLDRCRLKLSDQSRDNFIRSANCGIGISQIEPLRGIHIRGIGQAILEGADRPRATGDAAKTLSTTEDVFPMSYGTDAGRPGGKQTSDWRSIGILLAGVTDFSLENITLKDAHSWAISLEHCAFGTVRKLAFSADGGRVIDGAFRRFLNQDGLDLRQGCHDIAIEDISGRCGDDLVALTAIRIPGMHAGGLESHMVSGMESRGPLDDVFNITIRDVRGYAGGHQLVRFLNTSGIRMHDITLDGAEDTAPEGCMDRAVVAIGDSHPAWGGVTPLGDTAGFTLRNIRGHARHLVEIRGSLCDSTLENLANRNPLTGPVTYTSGRENVRNVTVTGALTLQEQNDGRAITEPAS